MFKPINSWKQDKFVIAAYSTWYGRSNVEEYMENLKKANIGLVISCDERELEKEFEMYDIFEKNEISFLTAFKPVLCEKRIEDEKTFAKFVERLKQYKSFYGFYVWDEPSDGCFEDILYNQQLMEEYAPGKATYVCLLPSYGPFYWDETAEDRESYVSHINKFISTSRPSIISNDYYPYKNPQTSLYVHNIYKDMGYLRKKSIECGIPYWHVFQAICDCTHHKHGFLTPNRIEAQINIALAHGAKGVNYFICSDIIVSDNGKKSNEFDAYAELNARTQIIGDELFGLKSVALYHGGEAKKLSDKYYADDIKQSAVLKSIPKKALVGVFENNKSEIIIAIVNKDYKKCLEGKIVFREEKKIYEFKDEEYVIFAESVSSIDVNIKESGISLFKLENK